MQKVDIVKEMQKCATQPVLNTKRAVELLKKGAEIISQQAIQLKVLQEKKP